MGDVAGIRETVGVAVVARGDAASGLAAGIAGRLICRGYAGLSKNTNHILVRYYIHYYISGYGFF